MAFALRLRVLVVIQGMKRFVGGALAGRSRHPSHHVQHYFASFNGCLCLLRRGPALLALPLVQVSSIGAIIDIMQRGGGDNRYVQVPARFSPYLTALGSRRALH